MYFVQENGDIDIEDFDFGNVKDVAEVGSTMASKLKAIGITSVFELATSIPVLLAVELNCTAEKARELIANANSLLEEKGLVQQSLMSAQDYLIERQNLNYLSTGSNAFNEMLKGGVESQSITEVFGEFSAGKSQLCHTLAVNATQDATRWQAGKCIYIDTEGTFRPERIKEIAIAKGLDPDDILSKTPFIRVSSAAQLQIIIQRALARHIEAQGARLVIVDSITSLHRAEYPGRGMLADRQQKLNLIMLKLHNIATTYKIPIVIANQVSHNPEGMFGDPVKAIGGNVIGHGSTYRIYLRRSGVNRVARMVDSPYHAYGEILFTVTAAGVVDIDEAKKK